MNPKMLLLIAVVTSYLCALACFVLIDWNSKWTNPMGFGFCFGMGTTVLLQLLMMR